MPISQLTANSYGAGTISNAAVAAAAGIATSKLGTGAVLRVVMNGSTGGSSTSSTTYVDVTNFTASITPSATTSKILVLATCGGYAGLVAGVNVLYYQQLLRGSTTLQEQISGAGSGSGGLQAYAPFAFSYLDSPATTSSTTYKIQHKVTNASSTGVASYGYIILMEIAG